MTSKMLCSKCDADVGTGINQDGSICSGICDSWYFACFNDLVDPQLKKIELAPFCRDNSLICSSVKDSFKSSQEFCNFMGFNVRDQKVDGNIPPDAEEDDGNEIENENNEVQNECYNGESR
jgi:hypothetical protein